MTGVPFTAILGAYPDARLAVECAFGADLAAADPGTWTWSDITADVMYENGGVSISPMGRGDETSKAQPAGCQFRLFNTSGAYSKGLPSSPYFPNVRRNTPVRVSVQRVASPTFRSVATTTSAAPSFAATAPAGVAAGDVVLAFHTADASYLGDLDKPTGANWRLLAEVETTATGGGVTVGYLATRVWYYRATGAAPANYTFTQGNVANGVVSIVAVQDAGLYTIKATMTSEVPPGASFDTPSSSPLRADDFELRWAAGSSLAGIVGVTWTPPTGLTERADAQSGNYTTGTLATRATGATTATGVKTFTASSSAMDWAHGVTVNFSNLNVRFQGQASGFTPLWDTSAKMAVVDLSASGKLRQLQQGKTPLRSALTRFVPSTSPLGYWPIEDGTATTQIASGLTGGPSMVVKGSIKFGSVDGPPGSAKLADFSPGGSASGPLPVGVFGTSWNCDFAAKFPTIGAGHTVAALQLAGIGGVVLWEIGGKDLASGGLYLTRSRSDGVDSTTTSGVKIDDGLWHLIRLDAQQSGSDIAWFLYIDGSVVVNGLVPGFTLGGLNLATVNPLGSPFGESPAMGHVAVCSPQVAAINIPLAFNGYAGETATARLARLSAEEGVPVEIRGTSDTKMGPQGVDTFLNLLRECETADDGVLYDGRGPGLAYTARIVRYNAAAVLSVDVSAAQLGDPFAPADDDQRDRNLIKASRKNGSSAIYEDDFSPLGTQAIGVYDAEVTVNTASDDGLYDRAAWEVHKGTVDAPYRYPRLSLDLGATPAVVDDWLSAGVSSRVDVLNVASEATQHPPSDVDLLLEGWAEQLSPFDWDAVGNCSPFPPWRVAVIEGGGDTAWRIDSGSSTLAAGVAAGATSLSVASADPAEVWSTSGGDYPRSVDVGGLEVTVTAVAGASSPQTFTVDALPYAVTAGSAVSLWHPPTIAL